jgi:hypothetical protein
MDVVNLREANDANEIIRAKILCSLLFNEKCEFLTFISLGCFYLTELCSKQKK